MKYIYKKKRQLTVPQRHKIVTAAAYIELDLTKLEFRETGIRYGYWSSDVLKLMNVADTFKLVELVQLDWEDSDCGRLYFLGYKKHMDMDFTDSSHSLRYQKPMLCQKTRPSKWVLYNHTG